MELTSSSIASAQSWIPCMSQKNFVHTYLLTFNSTHIFIVVFISAHEIECYHKKTIEV